MMGPKWFLFLLLCSVLVCGGVYAAASLSKGLLNPLFMRLKDRVERGLLSHYIANPLLVCETCIASTFGLGTYIGVDLLWHGWWQQVPWTLIGMAPVAICGTAIINHVLWVIINTLKEIQAVYAHERLNHEKRHAHTSGDQVQHTRPAGRSDR